ncbi:MAG TPA: hypothetical protein VF800_23015 [Telluria sp.]|jgi:type I restriction enzyme S subunit
MSQYEAYPAYKHTGVQWLGDVPSHWEVKRLRFFAKINPAIKLELLALPKTEVSFLPMDAISEEGSIRLKMTRPVADVQNGYSYFENGDVVFAKVTPCFENGKGAVMRDLIGGCGFGTTEITVLRPKKTATVRFINYILRSDRFRKLGVGSMTGAGGLKRVPDEFVRNFKSPLPAKVEQEAIVEHLDCEIARLYNLINKKNLFIELLREKRRAMITHAVTKGIDPNVQVKSSGFDWMGDVPIHWTVAPIKYFTTHIGSGKTPPGGAEVYQESGVLFLRSQNVYNDGLRLDDVAYISSALDVEMKGSRVQPNDVLLNITGASIGRSCIVPASISSANVNQHVCIIRTCQSELAYWISTYFVSDVIQAQIELIQNGAGREGLNFEQIGNMVVALPPVFERKAIKMVVDNETARIDTLISTVMRSIDLLKERCGALITAAVTGQIDVRDHAAHKDQLAA